MSALQENLLRVRAALAAYPRATLVGVSKFHSDEAVAEALQLGLYDLGENYAQALQARLAAFPQARWHFIGRLQSNKVKDLVGRCALIQSVDRTALVDAIERQCALRGVHQDILLQLSLDEDPTRGGCAPAHLQALCDNAAARAHITLRGLMLVPPLGADPRAAFAAGRAWFDRLRLQHPTMEVLSMGMTHDYDLALQEGATMVRVGSGIFGPRQGAAMHTGA